MRTLIFFPFLLFTFFAQAQFIATDIDLPSDTAKHLLKGTLLLPDHGNKFDLVVIQAGSGPTDRNGNSGRAITASSYRLLAQDLAAKNIATLLTDKRGVGKSIPAMKSEADLRFDDYANDLADWITFIKKDKRIRKIFIAGHSEGSLVGMIAAQKVKVNGYISIAGAGESIDKILVWQVTQQSPPIAHTLDSLLTRLRNNEKIDSVPRNLFSLLRPSVQPYMASWMQHDPCEEIKKIKIPVLIIQGTTDIQVEVAQANHLKECKPKATLLLIEKMNHTLKQSSADRKENLATYTNPALPVMPELVNSIATFVNKSK